ncbi:unnamed protein product, partial [Prorocentrum cordatum]
RPGAPHSNVAFKKHFAIMLRAIDQAAAAAAYHNLWVGGRDNQACEAPLFLAAPRKGSALRNACFVDDLTGYNSTASAGDEHRKIAQDKVTFIKIEGLPIKVQLVTQQKAPGAIVEADGARGPEICRSVNRTLVAASLSKTNAPDKHVTTSEAIAETGVPDVETHKTTARLRYLPRPLNHAPAVLLQLLDSQRQREGTWSHLLKQDFTFLRKHLPRDRWPSKNRHYSDIISWARQRPKHFTNAVKAAAKAYLHNMRDQAQLAKFQKDIQTPPTSSSTAEIDQTVGASETTCVCYVCGLAATKQGLAVHVRRGHPGRENPRR